MEKISIIIPVYNVEPYLERCLNSVINQTYSNIEIILVDDGSTDDSGIMCDDYKRQDTRIKVIHKENGGLSSARNEGLKYITGEYFTFIDSDDYMRTDYISKMYEATDNKKIDMVICRAKKVIGEEDYRLHLAKEGKAELLDVERVKIEMLKRKIPMYAHGKLFHKKLAKFICFPEGRIYEDVPTIWNVIKHVDVVAYLEEELYYYRQRLNSIVNSGFKVSRMDQCYFSEEIVKEVQEINELYYPATSLCFFGAVDNYCLITKEFPKEKKYLERLIYKYRRDVLKGRETQKILKVMAILSFFSLKLVKLLGKFYKLFNRVKWRLRYWQSRMDEKNINFKK